MYYLSPKHRTAHYTLGLRLHRVNCLQQSKSLGTEVVMSDERNILAVVTKDESVRRIAQLDGAFED
jgi:hypothetical protein